jgi:hypothetical protein
MGVHCIGCRNLSAIQQQFPRSKTLHAGQGELTVGLTGLSIAQRVISRAQPPELEE